RSMGIRSTIDALSKRNARQYNLECHNGRIPRCRNERAYRKPLRRPLADGRYDQTFTRGDIRQHTDGARRAGRRQGIAVSDRRPHRRHEPHHIDLPIRASTDLIVIQRHLLVIAASAVTALALWPLLGAHKTPAATFTPAPLVRDYLTRNRQIAFYE